MLRLMGIFALLLACMGGVELLAQERDPANPTSDTPVLLYGDYNTATITVYDPRKGRSFPLIQDDLMYHSSYFVAPGRGGILRVSNDPETNEGFVFALYPDWFSAPSILTGGHQGYVTPRWSPDGDAVIFETLRPSNFFLVRGNNLQIQTLNYPALVDSIWWWETNNTLLVWKQGVLSRLDVETGFTESLVSGLPWVVRNIVWTPDYRQVVYAWDCIDVLSLDTATVQTITCDGFDTSTPLGWLDDGITVYYVKNDEIRLYNTMTGEDRSAAQPPRQISWVNDVIYAQSGTPYLIHHTTFGDSPDARINIETGRVDHLLPDLTPRISGDFYPSPDGSIVAFLFDDPGQLTRFSPGLQSTEVIAPLVCCLVEWR